VPQGKAAATWTGHLRAGGHVLEVGHTLHVSQRALWTPVALQWGLATALPQERNTLWAKVRTFT